MPSFSYAQKTKYRITLELDVLDDFQPTTLIGRNFSMFRALKV